MTIPLQHIALQVPLTSSGSHAEAWRLPPREQQQTLHGELLVPPLPTGLTIFVAASGSKELAGYGEMRSALHRVSLATLEIDLLPPAAAHYPDAGTHLPLLTEHLLAVIAQLGRMMDGEVIPVLPIALVAAGDTTPVAVRTAAIRDQVVHALVCQGGLVDLAGLQYLRTLRAPLLMQLAADDVAAAENLRRARAHIAVSVESEPQAPPEQASVAMERVAHWIARRMGGNTSVKLTD